MARIKGVTSFAANFESEKAAPLVDMYCETHADMINATEQEAHDGAPYMYYGRRAIVFDDPNPDNNGTYQLIDPLNPTLSSSWEKFGAGGAADQGVEDTPKTFYISTTGSDTTGDGSLANPYATIVPIKKQLKPIIATSILIVYLAGTHTIDANTFKFNGFAIDGSSWSNYIQITGELQQVDTVTLTDNSIWKHEDSSKAYTVNEHVGRFLSDNDDYTAFPTLLPIAENDATVLTAGYGAPFSYSPNMIVEPATNFVMASGESLSFENLMSGSGTVWVTYLNIDSGNTTIDGEITGCQTYIYGVNLVGRNTVNGMNISKNIVFYKSFLELHARVYSPSEEGGIFSTFTCLHQLRPSTPSENTDSWFNHYALTIASDRIGYYNSYMYWRVVYNPGYVDSKRTEFESIDHCYYGHCGGIFNFRGRSFVHLKNGSSLTVDGVDSIVLNTTKTKGIVFEGKDMNIIGTYNTLFKSGALQWDFSYDGVAHTLNYGTSLFKNNVYIDISLGQYVYLPDIYPEFGEIDYLNVAAGTNQDLIIGNINNRRVKQIMDIDGGSEFANVTINTLNSDDTTAGLDSVLESQETGTLLKPSLTSSDGIKFTLSVNGSDEIVLNIENNSIIDANVRYYSERTNKA